MSSQGSENSVSSHTSSRSKNHQEIQKQSPYNKPHGGESINLSNYKATICSNSTVLNNNFSCNCECTAADFQKIIQTPNKIQKEKCKILNSVAELQQIPKRTSWQHMNCNCDNVHPIRESKIQNLNENEYIKSTSEISNVDDWSSKLIGSSHFRAVSKSTRESDDAFNAVPRISVVPPTPDGSTCTTMRKTYWEQLSSEQSPEDSPQDELPYRALSTTLKRYGTISSLGFPFFISCVN